MSPTIDRAPKLTRRDVTTKTPRATRPKVLLACGVLYAVLYVVANDVVAATRYAGYSRACRKLSANSLRPAPRPGPSSLPWSPSGPG
jgi:hypothetical protein